MFAAVKRVEVTRVAFLTCHLPYPPTSGGRLREHELVTRLADEFELHVVAISKTPGEDVHNASRLRRLGMTVTVLPAAGDPQNGSLHDQAFQVLRHRCTTARALLATLCAQRSIDVVHVEGFYLAQHVPPLHVSSLLVEQNAEFLLWRQRGRLGDPLGERQAELTLAAERAAWRAATVVATVTADDRAALLAEEPSLDVRVVPDGADHVVGRRATGRDPGTIVFVANFGYAPNVDAALHLIHDVWPDLRVQAPHARLLLVGGGVPPELLAAVADDPQIELTGRVTAVAPFLDAADVVVCPLRVGGGIKVKVLEAVTRGCALVTTSVGIQGLGDGVRDAVALADDPSDFVDAVVRLLFDGRERERLKRASALFAQSLPTWDDSADRLAAIYRELAAVTRSATPARAGATAGPPIAVPRRDR